MLRAWLARAWLMAGLLLSSGPLAAKTIEDRQVGDWQLVGLADDAGIGTACYAMGASFSEGQLMSVLIDRQGEWYLVIHGDWNLGPDAKRELTYAIDGAAPVAATAHGLGDSMLRVPLGLSFEATEPLRRGNRLEVRFKQGGQASFSLKGSSNALDALLGCATRHLAYQDDPDMIRFGTWLVLKKPHEDGSCRAGNAGEDDALFLFSYEVEAGYFIRLSHRKDEWELRDGEYYVLTYRIDNGPSVETYAGASGNTVLILLGEDAASLQPFKDGSRMEVQAARKELKVSLKDATPALEALQACAESLSASKETITDPFSSAAAEKGKKPIDPGAAPAEPLEKTMPTALPLKKGEKDRLFVPGKVGAWRLNASDKFGGFSECTLHAPFKPGEPGMMVSLDRDLSWFVTFTGTEMEFEWDKELALLAFIDAAAPVAVTGKGFGSDMLHLDLGTSPPLVAALRRGRQVVVQVGRDRFAVDLAGAGPAFSALEHCTVKLTAESPAPELFEFKLPKPAAPQAEEQPESDEL